HSLKIKSPSQKRFIKRFMMQEKSVWHSIPSGKKRKSSTILELFYFIFSHLFAPYVRTQVCQLFGDFFITPIDMFQTGYFGDTICHQSCYDKCRSRPEIGRFHFGTFQFHWT